MFCSFICLFIHFLFIDSIVYMFFYFHLFIYLFIYFFLYLSIEIHWYHDIGCNGSGAGLKNLPGMVRVLQETHSKKGMESPLAISPPSWHRPQRLQQRNINLCFHLFVPVVVIVQHSRSCTQQGQEEEGQPQPRHLSIYPDLSSHKIIPIMDIILGLLLMLLATSILLVHSIYAILLSRLAPLSWWQQRHVWWKTNHNFDSWAKVLHRKNKNNVLMLEKAFSPGFSPFSSPFA